MDTKNNKIFIIDDEPVNLKLLDKLLSKHGYTDLVLIHDPREVIEQYKGQRPDLILLDINMPYLNGFEVMAQLQALNDPLLPPIVILTAQNSKEYLMKALEAGARDFLTKPFDGYELQMRVRNLLDAHLAHRMLHDQKNVLEEMVVERTEKLQRTQLQIVQRLGMAAEYRDEDTGNHVLRMSHISMVLAKAVGWSQKNCELILYASSMHDVGKIGIPDSILLKPGKLDADEWELMKTHTTIGAELLAHDDSELMKMAHEIALSHHERWDGSGYPNGLAGEAIPKSGRITALADVFDALTSPRPYKKAWSIDDTMALIKDASGKHFDPELVDIFIQQLANILAVRKQFLDEE